MLTLLVSGALVATLAYLVFTWLRPAQVVADRGDVGPPAWAAVSESRWTPPRIDLELPRVDLELPLPYGLAIYRCEYRGEVTYSDRPCLVGRVRQTSLRRF